MSDVGDSAISAEDENELDAVPCTVEWHHSALLVWFDDGRSLLLQQDVEQAEFCYSCGLFELEENENHAIRSRGWQDCDPTQIENCPVAYYEADGGVEAASGRRSEVAAEVAPDFGRDLYTHV